MDISKIAGGYSQVPNNIKLYLSPNANMLLWWIFDKSQKVRNKTNGEKESVSMSLSILKQYLHISQNTIREAINELTSLHIINNTGEKRKAYNFSINWKQVESVCSAISQIGETNAAELYNLSRKNNTYTCIENIDISSMSKSDIDYDLCLNLTKVTESMSKSDIDSNLCQNLTQSKKDDIIDTSNAIESMSNSDIDYTDKQQSMSNSDIDIKNLCQNLTQMIQSMSKSDIVVCNESSHYVTKINNKCVLVVNLAESERILLQEQLEKEGYNAEIGHRLYINATKSMSEFDIDGVNLCQNLTQAMSEFDIDGSNLCQNLTTDNKYNNKKEKISESERSEFSYIGGKKEISEITEGAFKNGASSNNFFDNKVEVQDLGYELPDESVKDELDFSEKVEEVKEDNIEHSQLSTRNFKYAVNPYKNFPYFSKEEGMYITQQIEPGIEIASPVELFINIFWGQLWETYQDNYDINEYDENGDVIKSTEENVDDMAMIGSLLPAKDVLRTAANAYEELIDAINNGYIESNNCRCKISFQDFKEFDPFYIFDWKETNVEGESCLIVSIDKFKNIEAEEIVKLKAPKNKEEIKEERRNTRKMIKDIMTSDKNILTPVERVMRNFLDEFGTFDGDYELVGFTTKVIERLPAIIDADTNARLKPTTRECVVTDKSIYRQMFLPAILKYCKEEGIEDKVFYQTLEAYNSKFQIEEISCRRGCFSFVKTANVNLENQWISQITQNK